MAKKKQTLKAISQKPKVYEFKVSLVGTAPLVWRSFLVHDFVELAELHMLIQMTMGWQAYHLFSFQINGQVYTDAETASEIKKAKVSDGVLLRDIIGSALKFSYTYDFGDNWVHDVVIVRELEHDERMNYPICIGGANACPPEDCGGVGGFEELKEILAGDDCEEKDEKLIWLGGYYNLTTFDPNMVNRLLLWAEHSEA